MNTSPDNNIVNSNQYTPVYLIQNPGATQANYIFTLGHLEQKPVGDNLKTFYEKSGNIEETVTNVCSGQKPRVLKKTEGGTIGNNLKLASFLLPKNDNANKPYILNNIVLKPGVTPMGPTVNTVPKLDIDRKIVKLKDVPITPRNRPERMLPKIKPKENTPSPTPAKLTSVQLLKLGETYHSLNKLSEEQMKMVNQALKIFSNPEKIAPEPTYDPVTNTKFIYKVVSPRDLTVVGKKNILVKEKEDKRPETRKDNIKRQIVEAGFEEEPALPVQAKVTRSGRTVKLPKIIVPQQKTPHKPKKKHHIVNCFQCSTEFSSLYRLQKHYENHPTHIPAKIHSNLFHCLLAIVKGGSEDDRTNIFIQQLEQLIVKLKSLLPCLLNKIDGTSGKSCTITDDVGRIFGMNPGKYNIDVNALTCVKDKDGYCVHNPPINQVNSIDQVNTELNVPSEILVSNASEEITNPGTEADDCARISSAENWPTVNKRVWKLKKLKSQKLNAKKMRLEPENDTLTKLEMEDLESKPLTIEPNMVKTTLTFECDDILAKLGIESAKVLNSPTVPNNECNKPQESEKCYSVTDEGNKLKGNHAQFHSAHFDIRSSPMKPSSSVFRKFQINPEKLAKYDVQIIDASDIVEKEYDKEYLQTSSDSLHEIFRSNIDMSCKENNVLEHDWIIGDNDKSEDGFVKSNSLIKPALIHVKDVEEKTLDNNCVNHQNNVMSNDRRLSPNHGDSVLNFFDSLGNTCLSYPGTEIRSNPADFQMDLFSFAHPQ